MSVDVTRHPFTKFGKMHREIRRPNEQLGSSLRDTSLEEIQLRGTAGLETFEKSIVDE